MSLEALMLKELQGLLWGALRAAVGGEIGKWNQQRQLKAALDQAMVRAFRSLGAAFGSEGLDEDRLQQLADIGGAELAVFVGEPERLFLGGLDPERCWGALFGSRLPEAIVQQRLERPFELLGRAVLVELCALAPGFEPWDHARVRADFELKRRQLDSAERTEAVHDRSTEEAREARLLGLLRDELRQAGDPTLVVAGHPDEPWRREPLEAVFVHPRLVRTGSTGRRGSADAIEDLPCSRQRLLAPRGRTLIQAGPATGKSSWLHALYLHLLEHDVDRVPLLVDASTLDPARLPTPSALLLEHASPTLVEALSKELVQGWLEAGKVVVLVDGFDQLPLGARDPVATWLRGIDRIHDRCPLLLASRALSTTQLDDLSARWDRWYIELLDEQRIVAHVLAWLQRSGSPRATEREARAMARRWIGDPLVEPLTRTPISLSTLLAVYRPGTPVPRGRARLYRSYVDRILEARELDGPEHRRLLRALALGFTVTHPDGLDPDSCRALLRQARGQALTDAQADNLLAELCESSGLLGGPGDPSFLHRNLADFLLAEMVLRGSGHDAKGRRIDRFTLFRHRDDDPWNAALFFWADMADALELRHFVDACLERPGLDDWALALGLAEDQRARLGDDLLVDTLQRLLDRPPDPERESQVPNRGVLLHECPGPFATLIQAASVDLLLVRSVSGWSGTLFLHQLYLRHEASLAPAPNPDDELIEQYRWLADLTSGDKGRWFDALLAPPLLDIDELDVQSICLFDRTAELLREQRGSELATLIKLVREQLPALAERAPFLTMAALHWRAQDTPTNHDGLLEAALAGLDACVEHPVDRRWLAGSHLFCVDTFSDGRRHVDILRDAASRLRDAREPQSGKAVLGWIDLLLQRRELRRGR